MARERRRASSARVARARRVRGGSQGPAAAAAGSCVRAQYHRSRQRRARPPAFRRIQVAAARRELAGGRVPRRDRHHDAARAPEPRATARYDLHSHSSAFRSIRTYNIIHITSAVRVVLTCPQEWSSRSRRCSCPFSSRRLRRRRCRPAERPACHSCWCSPNIVPKATSWTICALAGVPSSSLRISYNTPCTPRIQYSTVYVLHSIYSCSKELRVQQQTARAAARITS